MKKSKAIQLVLVTGLLGTGANAFSNAATINNSAANPNHTINLKTNKLFKGNEKMPSGHYHLIDSTTHSSGSGGFAHPVTRGGWGSSGHHNSAAS